MKVTGKVQIYLLGGLHSRLAAARAAALVAEDWSKRRLANRKGDRFPNLRQPLCQSHRCR